MGPYPSFKSYLLLRCVVDQIQRLSDPDRQVAINSISHNPGSDRHHMHWKGVLIHSKIPSHFFIHPELLPYLGAQSSEKFVSCLGLASVIGKSTSSPGNHSYRPSQTHAQH